MAAWVDRPFGDDQRRFLPDRASCDIHPRQRLARRGESMASNDPARGHFLVNAGRIAGIFRCPRRQSVHRSEEHTSELQSLMRISYAVFCLKKKNVENTV